MPANTNLGSTPWFEERLALAMEARQAQVPPCPNGFIYIVQPGDTIFEIARRFGISIEAIVAANPQVPDPSRLRIGQPLCIPTGAPGPFCPDGFVYTVQPGDTLFSIARQFGVTVAELIAANPQLPDPNQLLVGQQICVPARVPVPPPPPACPGGFLYTVQPGDTLFSIARRFGVTVAELIAANPELPDPNQLQVGQQICVPTRVPGPPGPPACPDGFLYTIQPGDTLFSIARRFGVTVEEILQANPLITDPNQLRVGQRICIPTPVPGPPAPPACPDGFLYAIQPGDTLFSIARRFGVTVDELLQANPLITDPNQLRIGQLICIPRSPTASPPPSSVGSRSSLVLNPTDNTPNAEGVALFLAQSGVATVTAANVPPPGELGGSHFVAWLRRAGTDSWTRIPLTQCADGVFSGRMVLPADPSGFDSVVVASESIENVTRPMGLAVLEGDLSRASSPPA